MGAVSGASTITHLVGRERLLARLDASIGRGLAGARTTVVVTGQSGIGKTSVVRAAAVEAGGRGAQVGWGTCVEGASAPGYWPWTQLLNGLARTVGAGRAREVAAEDAPLLATIASGFGEPPKGEVDEQTRFLLMDATSRWLDALASESPVLVVIDDLQWADDSSLALVEFLARVPHPAAVSMVVAYRHDELPHRHHHRIATFTAYADHLHVEGLDRDAVRSLVASLAGATVSVEGADEIHRRTAGHPFFIRELALLPTCDASDRIRVPVAVGEAIERRMGRLPEPTHRILEAAAVTGLALVPDVVAGALALSHVELDRAVQPAVDAGVLVPGADGRTRFTHDLFREAVLAGLETARRIALHQRIGAALEDHLARGGDVAPSELAYHFAAAIPLDGTERASRWALAAAAAESSALAFGEGAAHLRRLRGSVVDAGAVLDDPMLAEVLLAEADALARAGSALDARGLLRMAREVADRCRHPHLIARAALAVARLGARFATRRDETVRELETALASAIDVDVALEAQLTAALARELQHSVPEDRPRAGPLSRRALDLGRNARDPVTLAACLLARHDVLWTPGTADERFGVASEIVAVAHGAGDQEGEAEGLLLLANAQLERGSAAYLPALNSCLDIAERLAQPRHRYTAETRRAALALLGGRLDEAAERIAAAAALGERIREPDVANVAMSQRLELIRARGDPDELRAFAADAVAHWTGAPVHAHAVAAGFLTRAGDLDAARPHVATVVDLGTWRADRSYLWSVFVHELSRAAVALDDGDLCAQLLEDLVPLGGSCGVNGAVVAFAGSHAHTSAILASALGSSEAGTLFDQACTTYQRLGALAWLDQAQRDRRSAEGAGPASTRARLRRRGSLWHITYAGREAIVPHSKGLADIAVLVHQPGVDVHVLDLVDAGDRTRPVDEIVDRRALESYRQRLADIDDEATQAHLHNDIGRVECLAGERQALLDELGRVSGVRGRSRQFSNHPAERARKAVAARIRDAVRHLQPLMPELAAHLDRGIVTGARCRYRAEDAAQWEVELSG